MPRKSPTFAPLAPAPSSCAGGVLTLKEAAAFAGVGVTHLRRLCDRGVLPSAIPGKRRVIPKAALVKWLDEQMRV